ncbi:hypothetical protein [Paracidovorax wautersii]|uniref:hypothetical protein n=1 Tax=Paracidovorax wautersii TaxID=1177982 RepID=UPI0011136139|nr:hypothetical protein [Paracidovorax wautersii]
MKYQLRFLLPFETSFVEVEGEDLADAACSLLGLHLKRALFIRPADAGRSDGDTSYFAQMECEGEGAFTARYFFGGIGRSGGVKPLRNPLQCSSVAEVEMRLGLEPGSLDCEWMGEESAEDAWNRKQQAAWQLLTLVKEGT